MPKWPKLTKPIVRAQPLPTYSSETSPLIDPIGSSSSSGGGGGGSGDVGLGINGDVVTAADIQNAFSQTPPAITTNLGGNASYIYAFIVCHGRLPVKGDDVYVGSALHDIYECALSFVKYQAAQEEKLTEGERKAFAAIPLWPSLRQ